MIKKHPATDSKAVVVTFKLPATIWAEQVHLVGDFNDWSCHSHPLQRCDDDTWHITLELQKGNSYQFRYLIDGQHWQNDWNADRYVPNPFGGDNSVLDV